MRTFLTTPLSSLTIFGLVMLSFLLIGIALAATSGQSERRIVLQNYGFWSVGLTFVCAAVVIYFHLPILPSGLTQLVTDIEVTPFLFCLLHVAFALACMDQGTRAGRNQLLCFVFGLVGGIYGLAGVQAVSRIE